MDAGWFFLNNQHQDVGIPAEDHRAKHQVKVLFLIVPEVTLPECPACLYR